MVELLLGQELLDVELVLELVLLEVELVELVLLEVELVELVLLEVELVELVLLEVELVELVLLEVELVELVLLEVELVELVLLEVELVELDSLVGSVVLSTVVNSLVSSPSFDHAKVVPMITLAASTNVTTVAANLRNALIFKWFTPLLQSLLRMPGTNTNF